MGVSSNLTNYMEWRGAAIFNRSTDSRAEVKSTCCFFFISYDMVHIYCECGTSSAALKQSKTTLRSHFSMEHPRRRWFRTLDSGTAVNCQKISTQASATKLECKTGQQKARQKAADQSVAPLNFTWRRIQRRAWLSAPEQSKTLFRWN